MFVIPASTVWSMRADFVELDFRATEYFAVGLVLVVFVFITHLANTLTHRYFAHRCFKTSRGFTFVLACFSMLGTKPMWWSSIHRRHHKHCDAAGDPHPPVQKGFAYAYVGWLVDRDNFRTRLEYIGDWVERCPELLLLDMLRPLVLSAVLPLFFRPVEALASWGLVLTGTDSENVVGMRELGFFQQAAGLGVAFAAHQSLLFNAYAHTKNAAHSSSAAHKKGDRHSSSSGGSGGGGGRCLARDLRSRAFAIISGGESYHARHHKYPRLAQNSPRLHEDWVFCFIAGLERAGLVWDVRREAGCEISEAGGDDSKVK